MMLFEILILVPSKDDDENIKYSKEYEENRMSERIAVHLIRDEQEEYNNRGWIRP